MENKKKDAKNPLWSILTNFWVLFIMFGVVFFLEGYGKRYLPPSPENMPHGTVAIEEPKASETASEAAQEAKPEEDSKTEELLAKIKTAPAPSNIEEAPATELKETPPAKIATPPVAKRTPRVKKAAVKPLKTSLPHALEAEVPIEELDNEPARQNYLAENKRLSSRKEVKRETYHHKSAEESGDFIPFER